MSVHYAPQETGGSDILQTAMNFDRWMAEHRQALLNNQIAQSQLQEQAARTDLVKTEAQMNRGKLGEFNDTSTQRRALLDAQVQAEQNTAGAEGSRAALLKHEVDRIPITDANNQQIFEATQAKLKQEYEKLGVDTQTAKLRLLNEAPQAAADLAFKKSETEQVQAHTQVLKAQLGGVQQDIVNANVGKAAEFLKQRANNDMSQSDFDALKKLDPAQAPFVKYLQPFSGQEAPAKTMDEFKARVAQRALTAAGTVTDPNEQQKLTNFIGTLVDPQGIPFEIPAKTITDPKTGAQIETSPAKTVRSLAPVQESFAKGFGAMFNANNQQKVDVSQQPGLHGTSIGRAINTATGKPGQNTTPDTSQQSSGYDLKAAENALYSVDTHIKANKKAAELPWVKNKSGDNFFSTTGESKADFVAGVTHDPNYMISKGGDVYNSTQLETQKAQTEKQLGGKTSTEDWIGQGVFNPLKDQPDFVNAAKPLFKNGMNDPTATAGQTARFATWAGQLARGYNEGGVNGLKQAFTYFDDHFPANDPSGVTNSQAFQLAKLVKLYSGK